jgi:hypothetical protein
MECSRKAIRSSTLLSTVDVCLLPLLLLPVRDVVLVVLLLLLATGAGCPAAVAGGGVFAAAAC